jgi:hypothetical protein
MKASGFLLLAHKYETPNNHYNYGHCKLLLYHYGQSA